MDSNDRSLRVEDLSFEAPDLPDEKDNLFTTADDWQNNACLTFGADRWWPYVVGYKEAADLLVSTIDRTQRHQDTMVFPIVFLYRHYLELGLKNLIRQGRRLLDVDRPVPQGHRIDELWRICSALLQEISPDDAIEAQQHIGRLIDEFCQIDATSTAFRYPVDINGNPSLSGLAALNLRNLRDVMAKIAVILNGASDQIDELLQIKWDMY